MVYPSAIYVSVVRNAAWIGSINMTYLVRKKIGRDRRGGITGKEFCIEWEIGEIRLRTTYRTYSTFCSKGMFGVWVREGVGGGCWVLYRFVLVLICITISKSGSVKAARFSSDHISGSIHLGWFSLVSLWHRLKIQMDPPLVLIPHPQMNLTHKITSL